MPDSPDVLLERAARYYQARAFEAAASCALLILAQDAAHFDALHLLGVLSLNKGQNADAVGYLTRAARLRPDDGAIPFALGNAFAALHLHEQAIAAYRRAPANEQVLNNLGAALRHAGRTGEAIETFRRVLARQPHFAPAWFNLGESLAAAEQWEEAVTAFRAALTHAAPDTAAERLARIAIALGNALVELDRVEAARAACEAMRTRFPDNPALIWHAGLAALHLGDYRSGWRDYEARFLVPGHDPPRADASMPDISALAGKRVLLLGEQGRGDVLQFVRYAPLLAERGATVHLSVTDDLKPLLSGMDGVSTVIGEDEAEPPYDIVTPVMSLPHAFGTTLETVPNRVPYLRAPASRISAWRDRLAAVAALHVGLCWASTNPGPRRGTDLETLRPLLDCPGVRIHALQKAIPDGDRACLHRHPAVQDHSADLTDFAETAALIEALDLVISIDTAVAHLAGGLGKPVWIMLPHVAEWRWLRGRGGSPWYPSARLFRQPAPGDWAGLTDAIATALSRAVASPDTLERDQRLR